MGEIRPLKSTAINLNGLSCLYSEDLSFLWLFFWPTTKSQSGHGNLVSPGSQIWPRLLCKSNFDRKLQTLDLIHFVPGPPTPPNHTFARLGLQLESGGGTQLFILFSLVIFVHWGRKGSSDFSTPSESMKNDSWVHSKSFSYRETSGMPSDLWSGAIAPLEWIQSPVPFLRKIMVHACLFSSETLRRRSTGKEGK